MQFLRILFLCFLTTLTLRAQAPSFLKFEHITEEDGLSAPQVQCVAQDPKGFLWFGTANGLDRYDGRGFKVFRHREDDSTTIPDNSIDDIAFDKSGNMWLATGEGIALFDPDHGKAKTFLYLPKGKRNFCHRLFFDHEGILWFSCSNGLGRLDPKTEKIQTFRMFGAPEDFHTIWLIGSIFEDSKKNLWIGAGLGLYLFDRKTCKFTQVRLPCSNYPNVECENDNIILKILEDSDHYLWLGTWGAGLKRYDPRTGECKTYVYDLKGIHGTCNVVSDIIVRGDEYGKDLLWLGTCDKGVAVFDKKRETFRFFNHDPFDLNSLSSEYVFQVFDDGRGTMWVPTVVGLNKTDKYAQRFERHTVPLPDIPRPAFPYVTQLFSDREDPSGNTLWIGVDFNGIFKYNRSTEKIESWYHNFPVPKGKEELTNNVKSLVQASDGEIWFGSDAGLYHLDKKAGKAERIPLDDSDKTYIPSIAEDRHGNLWLATYNGLVEYTPATKAVKRWTTGTSSLSDDRITYVTVAHDGKIWLGTRTKGVDVFDPSTQQFTSYYGRIRGNSIGCISEDPPGRLWIATDQGLTILEPKSGKMTHYGEDEGLPGRIVYTVFVDELGRGWLSSRDGVVCVDDTKKSCKVYRMEDGLYQNDIGWAFSRGRGDEVFIGFGGMYQSFHTLSMTPDPVAMPARITGLHVLGNPVDVDPDSVAEFPLSFSYDQNIITFEFASGNYSHAAKNHYQYLLEGFDRKWIDGGNKMSATYTNLDGGDYVFRVKAANADGIWNETPAVFRIHVIPPFWKTTWFRILAVLLIALLIFLLYRRSVSRVRTEERQKTEFNRKVADAEMKALRAQMNPHFIFNCMNTIDALVMQSDYEKASAFLNKFSRLIRMVLENSMHRLVPLKTEIQALEIYLQLERERFEEHFDFSISISDSLSEEDFFVPPLLLQPYVENAILHGLRHKEEKGNIRITIGTEQERMKVIVEDDGIGRKNAAAIRERNRPGHRSVGTKVTNERIEIFNFTSEAKAELHMEDLEDENGNATGTRVTLYLPLITVGEPVQINLVK